MRRRLRTRGWLGLCAAAAVAAAASGACYQAPGLTGPYRCNPDGTCGDGDMVCDDGVCCQPFGFPVCRTLVLDGGVCGNGATPKTWFLDKDGDGHGDVNSERLACAQPVSVPESAPNAAWIEKGGDCNDDEPGVRPGASELCDEVDNDCDGEADELFAKQTYYVDKDQDGFGQKDSQGFVLCAAQGDYTSTEPSDCDDGQAGVNPDASELCNGVDDDCSGAKDDSPTDVGAPCASGLPGVCAAGTVACQGGALACAPDVAVGQRNEVCNGVDDDCDNEVDEALPDICLLAPSVATQRAQDSGVRSGGSDLGCLADRSGSSGASYASPLWTTQAGGNTQVFIARLGSAGAKWNVTTRDLNLYFEADLVDPNGAWSAYKQPVVFLCATDGTYARYVHTSDTNWNAKPASITLNETFTLNLAQFQVNRGWTQTEPTPPLDRVNWVEIHLETSAVGMEPATAFTVRWRRLKFQ